MHCFRLVAPTEAIMAQDQQEKLGKYRPHAAERWLAYASGVCLLGLMGYLIIRNHLSLIPTWFC